MRFIGDVHGHTVKYLQIRGEGPSFQIGDMGLGFPNVFLPKDRNNHVFIRGNHDDPAACRVHPDYAGDWGFDAEKSLFFMGGAYSIDQDWRKKNMRWQAFKNLPVIPIWWPDEELSEEELKKAEELYLKSKPRIVATHDCPTSASVHLLRDLLLGEFRPEKQIITRTGEALERMLQAHQPEVWIFGHYHIDREFQLRGCHTKFICLGELNARDIEVETALEKVLDKPPLFVPAS